MDCSRAAAAVLVSLLAFSTLRPVQPLLVLAGQYDASPAGQLVSPQPPQVVEITAGSGTECLAEVGVYYGSDFPPGQHRNASSAAACCRLCQGAPNCTMWNWCGLAEGCLFPNLLSDADGRPGVPFRTCDLKPYPITVVGTSPLAPEVARTGDMAAWTSGIPMDSRLLRDVPGYDLYQASALPFGPLSQDFACPGSATSKNVCELAGNLTAAAQACTRNTACQGFQFCTFTPRLGAAPGQIRLKSGLPGALNMTNAVFNPYCSLFASEDPSRSLPAAMAPRRNLLQTGSPGASAPAPVGVAGFNPLISTVLTASSPSNVPAAAPASPAAAAASSGAQRRPGSFRPLAAAPVAAVPSMPPSGSSVSAGAAMTPSAPPAGALAAAPQQQGEGSAAGVPASPQLTAASPGAARASPGGFDSMQGTSPPYMGGSSVSQVNSNSQGYTTGTAMNTLTGAAASGGEDSPEPITPDNGAVDESLAPGGQPQLAGTDYWANTTVKSVAIPPALLPAGAPAMQAWPRATFRYRTCDVGSPTAYVKIDNMPVPAVRPANATLAAGNATSAAGNATSAYAVHVWVKAPFAANISCNHSCAHRLADDDFFNLQDTTIARARPAYITSIPAVAQVPVADLTRASDGSVPAVPMYYLPRGELANATASAGLRFRMLRSNQSSYVNELSHLAYFVAQAALGNKRCSPGFPGLQVAVAYLQAALQQEVATISGQPFGSFASLNGVPLNMDFITAADITNGAKRGFGQACLTEENAVYQGSVLVAGAGHSVASAEDCCAACWNYGGKPGRGMNSSSGVRDHPGMVSGGAPGPAAFAGSNMTAAEKRARGYGLPPVYTPADGVQCNAWAFCASPLGCTAGSPGAGQALTPQGFCELKYSEAVARHAPADAARSGAGFVSGRTTAVLPSDAPNLFGIGSI